MSCKFGFLDNKTRDELSDAVDGVLLGKGWFVCISSEDGADVKIACLSGLYERIGHDQAHAMLFALETAAKAFRSSYDQAQEHIDTMKSGNQN